MKILHTVEFYSPSVGGAQEVVRQVSERLAQRGHDVTVATTADERRTDEMVRGVRVKGFNVAGRMAHGIAGDVEGYRSFVRDSGFDVVMSYAAQQWATDALIDRLDAIPCAKVLAPCGFSGLMQPEWAGYFAKMPTWLRGFDQLIFHSDSYRDISFCRWYGLNGKCQVVPNGAGEDEFGDPPTDFREKYNIDPDVSLLVTVGSHTNLKGHHECIRMLMGRGLGPVVLVLIGNRMPVGGCADRCHREARLVNTVGLGKRKVMVLDPPRRDVIGAMAAADLYVFASNIECSPLVLFESMASGLPFVSADVGNAREIAAWGGGGVIMPTHRHATGFSQVELDDFRRIVGNLLADSEQRQALGQRGREAWQQRFTWERIVSDYEEVYRAAIEKRKPNIAPAGVQTFTEAVA